MKLKTKRLKAISYRKWGRSLEIQKAKVLKETAIVLKEISAIAKEQERAFEEAQLLQFQLDSYMEDETGNDD